MLSTYIIGLPLRDILHQKAQVTMNLLHTLVINYQIFEMITSKKMQLPSQAELNAGAGAEADSVRFVGGFTEKTAEEDGKRDGEEKERASAGAKIEVPEAEETQPK